MAPVSVTATHYDGSQVTADATLVAAYAARGKTYTDTLNGVCYSTLVVPGSRQRLSPFCRRDQRQEDRADLRRDASIHAERRVVYRVADYSTARRIDQLGIFHRGGNGVGRYDGRIARREKRILGLTLDNEQSVTQWISLLLGYTGCALWYDNGEWGITAETATYTAPFSVTEALMKDGEIDVQSRNVKNAPTVVRIWYTNTSAIPWREEYAEASLPGAGSTLPYLLSEVRMPAIQRYSHAYREAYEQLYDYQLGDLTASFVTRDQGLKIMPGDVFPITHSIRFSAKPFPVHQHAGTGRRRTLADTDARV